MSTAPYVLRDQARNWYFFQLPRATDQRPVGTLLIIYIQPDENLDLAVLENALKSALQPAPVGDWYLITVDVRYIRKSPITTAQVLNTMYRGEKVQVIQTSENLPYLWGRVNAIEKVQGRITPQAGYIYLNSLKKL